MSLNTQEERSHAVSPQHQTQFLGKYTIPGLHQCPSVFTRKKKFIGIIPSTVLFTDIVKLAQIFAIRLYQYLH